LLNNISLLFILEWFYVKYPYEHGFVIYGRQLGNIQLLLWIWDMI